MESDAERNQPMFSGKSANNVAEARSLAAEVGYVAAFAGKADRAPAISRAGSDLFAIARVGEDYVERLPGPGRRSLLSVLREKLGRK